MDAVFGLLLLLGVCHGVETSCDGRQNGAECYGALGGTVLLQLMDDASEVFKYDLKKETTVILHGRRGNILTDLTKSRFSFTPNNGTFRINNLSRDDGGQYSGTAYLNSSGTNPVTRTLQLIIQAPVSSVQLVPECQSQGEMRVSCSSGGGDSPQYSWTLDGKTLTGTQLLSGNSESQNITLKQDVSGQLKCTVRNHISSVPGEKMISTCGFKLVECTLLNGTYISQWLRPSNETLCIKSTTEVLPIAAGVLVALLVLLAVGVGVVYTQKKKQNKQKEDNDEQELTYAEVKVGQRPGRQLQQSAELEVEYDQVKFSQRPRQPVEPSGDECVYSKVRRGR
ncbi:uncharacterized protein LOC117816882 isoform X2 [Notolabrus celidotus]|uniref:uncharacterized protein LOC117816882 isoform X2 n=1 Tax=Notolabrus celidotus TaxID=1203425 RepID=UPI00148F5702|nr:uncharacterized protein LOC117816882 isoform X2 [Notolabrus celidotus]